MTKMFLFSDYWPKPKTNELQKHEYFNPDDGKKYANIYWNSGDNKIFYEEDYHDGVWLASWIIDYYNRDNIGNPRGIVETADIYPRRSYQFWTKYRITGFKTGYEIPWGFEQKIGDVIDKQIKISSFKSTFFEAPITGRQIVSFVKKHDTFETIENKIYQDVLEVCYDQTFNNKTTGNRGFYAKNIGLVQMRWRSNNEDVGSIITAKITRGAGYIDENKMEVWHNEETI